MTFKAFLLISIPFYSPLSKLAEHISEQHRQYRVSQYLKWEDESEGPAFPLLLHVRNGCKEAGCRPSHAPVIVLAAVSKDTHTEQ